MRYSLNHIDKSADLSLFMWGLWYILLLYMFNLTVNVESTFKESKVINKKKS